MKNKFKFSIIMGAILFAGGLFFQTDQVSFLVTAGMVLILTSLIRHFRIKDEVERDERTQKIAYTALAASFQLSLLLIMALWWINYFNPIALDVSTLIAAILLSMIFISIGARIFYSRKII